MLGIIPKMPWKFRLKDSTDFLSADFSMQNQQQESTSEQDVFHCSQILDSNTAMKQL